MSANDGGRSQSPSELSVFDPGITPSTVSSSAAASTLPTRTGEPTSEDDHNKKYAEEGKQVAVRALQATEAAASAARKASFFPTVTPVATLTPYPTASSTTTSSPFPTATLDPTTDPDEQAFDEEPTYFPTATLYPKSSPFSTASSTPTTSPLPSLSLYPTKTSYPTASSSPTSTAFPSFVDPSSAPSSSGDGAVTVAPTGNSSAIDVPTIDSIHGHSEQPRDGEAPSSLGYSKTCEGATDDNLNSGTETELVFMYTVESVTASDSDTGIATFLNELEIHLLDMAAKDTLQCDSALFDVEVFRLRYSETEPASETSECFPEHVRSRSCWIIQTKLLVSTDRMSAHVAKYAVLEDIQAQLNDQHLVARTFPELTFTSYLGPEPLRTTEPGPGDGTEQALPPYYRDPPKETTMTIVGATVGVFAFVAMLTLIVVYIHQRTHVEWKYTHSERSRETNNIALHDDESEASSIEIFELLSRSKVRLQDVPISSSTEEDSLDQASHQATLLSVHRDQRGNGTASGPNLNDSRRKRSSIEEAKNRSTPRQRLGGDASSVSSGSYSDLSITARRKKSAKELALEMVERGYRSSKRSSKRSSARRKLEAFEDEPPPSRVEFTQSSQSGRVGSSRGGRREPSSSSPSLFGDPFEAPQGYGNGGASTERQRSGSYRIV